MNELSTMNEPFTHRRTITYGACDSNGIVCTSRFVEYCMEAVEEWLKGCIGANWYLLNTQYAISTPVEYLKIDFLGPLIPGDELSVHVIVENVGRSSFTVRLNGTKETCSGSNKCFSAMFVFTFVENKSNTIISIPNEYREKILLYKACGTHS